MVPLKQAFKLLPLKIEKMISNASSLSPSPYLHSGEKHNLKANPKVPFDLCLFKIKSTFSDQNDEEIESPAQSCQMPSLKLDDDLI